MSKDIQQQLQECLEGYDGGLSPEECLSAYPARERAELEPLFRQALSLRVAYAASPNPEYKFRVREKLLFAAGRDVSHALSAEPDPSFVQATRRRLLNTAGADAQEALRDVPPPRLPFWVNARRRLLETAQAGPPPPRHASVVGLRSALSAAVVVLAVAIAGAGFFLQDSPANRPTQAALRAELDYIDQRVSSYEQLHARGQIVPPTEMANLVELAERTSKLAELYSADNAAMLDQLPSLIDRQQSLLSEESTLNETLADAQARLDEADLRVAAVDPTSEASPTETAVVAAVETTEPTVEATAEETPEPTSTPDLPEVALVSPSDVRPNGLVWQYDDSVDDLGLRWYRVTTSTMTFVMPEAWTIENLDTDANGLAFLPVPLILVRTDLGLTLAISTETGEVNVVNTDPPVTLRTEGVDGEPVDPAALAEITGADGAWASLFNMLNSIGLVVEVQADDTTPEPSSTAESATPDSEVAP